MSSMRPHSKQADEVHRFRHPDIPLTLPPNGHSPLVPQRGVTYLVKTRQVTQMSYAGLYKHVALFAVTIYKYVHTSPSQIFLHQIHKNAMRTISTPDQFTHILPSTISCITTPRYYFHSLGLSYVI